MTKQILALMLAAVLCLSLFAGCKEDKSIPTTAPSSPTDPTSPADPAAYDISATVLNFFYVDAISSQYSAWKQTFGEYTQTYLKQYYLLDLTVGLDSQFYDSTTQETWADYFLDIAKQDAKETYALSDQADAEEYTLSDDAQAEYDSWVANYQSYANLYGISADELVQTVYGDGATFALWKEYLLRIIKAQDFADAYGKSLTYDSAALKAYEQGREQEFSAYSYAVYHISYVKYPHLGTEVEGSTAFTAEQKQAALNAAKADAETLTSANTVEELNTLIAALSFNSESKSAVATVAENQAYAELTESLRAWLTDPARQAGDATTLANISKNDDGTTVTNGYYAVLFTGRNENLRPLANVRHILVEFEGGTTNPTEEQKTAAKTEADRLLALWKEKSTEEYFIELVKEYTADSGSKETGGLYEDISPETNFVESFLNWSIDPARQAGDTGIVESVYGYHIMYYVSDDEVIYRDMLIERALKDVDYSKWYDGIMDAYTPTFDDAELSNYDYVILPS